MDTIGKFGSDNHSLIVAALRIVPHVPLRTSSNLQSTIFGILHKVLDLLDTGRIVHLDDIVAGGRSFTVECVVSEACKGALHAKGEHRNSRETKHCH